ncbi:ABC transporter G family member 31 like [Heracleum sosnowskyi]|uniref:ABC transporter G family member 31 like n=1 Tax=Heracleum sosnowskyi TaxID=360622 RepID=A0AAD8IVY8_9APIA|nr:ABC transporter G family member 31 like [Heracleum sosnowskyi]
MAASNGSELYDLEAADVDRDEKELLWAALERLPSRKRTNYALIRGGEETETVDVRKLDQSERELVVKNALDTSEQDNFKLLSAVKERLDRVGIEVPKVDVCFQDLTISAKVQVGSRALPTLVNYTRDLLERLLTTLRIYKPRRHKLTILNNISGAVKPGRMTLLLGPPGSGKSTLLLALAGKLDSELKKSGNITYNGHMLDEFCIQRTSAYISQTDNHIAELTVRETLDFAARCEGASEGFAGFLEDLTRLEKENNIRPSPEIDAFMKASSIGGRKHSISTDYILKVLGLDICADTVVGSDMNRGVSGGQRKRVTTGEMVVGPRKTLFMDEISTGLDSSTTYQIVKCGPRAEVVNFFESLGFQLPPRKGVADFLQEVTSRKDQAQYWADSSKPYVFLPVSRIAEEFLNSRYGRSLKSSLSVPYDKSKSHPSALAKTRFSVSKIELFKTCFVRECLLIRRHSFLYIFRTCQVGFVGIVTCTMFLRTRVHPTDVTDGELYLSCLFFGLVHLLFNGFTELPLMIFRLPVFYKQRDNYFYPAWAWSISSWILRVPYSVVEAIVWSCIVYYTVGFAPGTGRFFRYMFLLFTIHQMALGLFRSVASISRDIIIANTFASAGLLIIFLLGGFIIPKDIIKPWWIWAFWISPLSYGQRAISVNEFTATRWMEKPVAGNTTIGYSVLHLHSLPADDNWYWLGVGVLILYTVFFNVVVTLALSYLNPIKKSQAIIPLDAEDHNATNGNRTEFAADPVLIESGPKRKGMILPFQPLTMTFHNVDYFVDMPKEMRTQEVNKEQQHEFVEQVMQLVELDSLRNALVGLPGSTGLSTEQRKRLTIAVELVANPSIIFMDEPTSGLDARAAAIVMRAVRNTVDTQRTVVCTIHQPSIEIFEAFDELLLMKRGGQVIYGGKLGEKSQTMINYFQGIPGISPFPDEYNPATWMLEISTPAAEERIGRDFADIYRHSDQYREVEASIQQHSVPPEGSKPLRFPSTYSRNMISQFKICLWKQNLVYFRSPAYNSVRLLFTTVSAFVLGTIFWDIGAKRGSTQDIQVVMGALFAAVLFLGVNNAASVQPVVSIERTVFYREKAAGMYSPFPYAAAQGLVEIPYIILQTIIYGVITYFMINFERTAAKFFLYLVFMFLTFTYFTFYGMMAIGLTPTQHLAAVISSAFYSLWNLLSGFLVPKPKIPGWWIWFYYICPVSWTLRVLNFQKR